MSLFESGTLMLKFLLKQYGQILRSSLSGIHKSQGLHRAGTEIFNLTVEVSNFKPEEIVVEVVDNKEINVVGKQEENFQGKSYVTRHFVGRYVIPENLDLDKMEAKFSGSGLLSITAPKFRPTPIEPPAKDAAPTAAAKTGTKTLKSPTEPKVQKKK